MGSSDIVDETKGTKMCDKENCYENTKAKTGTVERVKQKEDGHYEALKFDKEPVTRKAETSKNCFLDGSLKRMQILLYINLSVLLAVCVAVIGVVIFITIPKDKDNHVSFFAKMADENVLLGPEQRVVFNNVLNNDMNGYSSTTGVFVAPVSGIYSFSYFIEVKNVYGKVDLILENRLISSAIAYGRPTEVLFDISGIDNTVVLEATKRNEIDTSINRHIACSSGQFRVSGIRNNLTVQPALDRCPYTDGLPATGGNTAIVHVNAGEKVWIQTASEEITTDFRSNGTSFAGFLIFNN